MGGGSGLGAGGGMGWFPGADGVVAAFSASRVLSAPCMNEEPLPFMRRKMSKPRERLADGAQRRQTADRAAQETQRPRGASASRVHDGTLRSTDVAASATSRRNTGRREFVLALTRD